MERKADGKGFLKDTLRTLFMRTVLHNPAAGGLGKLGRADERVYRSLCIDELSSLWKRIYEAVVRSSRNVPDLLMTASLPAVIISAFTDEEIERDRQGFGDLMSELLRAMPESYCEKRFFQRNCSPNVLLYIGGYRPTSGAGDPAFWFGLDGEVQGGGAPVLSPFSIYTAHSQTIEDRRAETAPDGSFVISEDPVGLKAGIQEKKPAALCVIPPLDAMDEEQEKELWDILVRGARAFPEKWEPLASAVARAYLAALSDNLRNDLYGYAYISRPGGSFISAEFLDLPLVLPDRDGKINPGAAPRTIFDHVSEQTQFDRPSDYRYDESFGLFDLSGKTLAQRMPDGKTVFDKWLESKETGWNRSVKKYSASLKNGEPLPPFSLLNVLNYTNDCEDTLKQHSKQILHSVLFQSAPFCLAKSMAAGALAVKTVPEYLSETPSDRVEQVARDAVTAAFSSGSPAEAPQSYCLLKTPLIPPSYLEEGAAFPDLVVSLLKEIADRTLEGFSGESFVSVPKDPEERERRGRNLAYHCVWLIDCFEYIRNVMRDERSEYFSQRPVFSDSDPILQMADDYCERLSFFFCRVNATLHHSLSGDEETSVIGFGHQDQVL